MRDSRSNLRLGLLTTTLTELLLMVLFVLLLVGLREYSRLRADLAEARTELETQTGELEEARIDLELRSEELKVAEEALHQATEWPEDFERLVHASLVERASAEVVRAAARLQVENEELTTRLVAVAAEARAQGEEAERLRTALAGKIGSEAADALSDALHEAERAKERAASLQEEVTAARSQLRFVQEQNRAAGRGMDHPPCWVSPGGRIEYLLSVTVGEELLSARPAWPPHREAAARSLPGIGALLENDLSPEAFAERSGPILAWSKSQNPECRHFVRVGERAETVDGFKTGLLAVESAFYKYLER